MARARNIKPGFFKNEELAECSLAARLCFPGLWLLADREGRLEDRPKRIKGELFPFDTFEVGPLLDELHARGFIVRYRNEAGSFIQISKFLEHQNPHYSEKPSVIKPPTLPESEASKPAPLPDDGGDDGGGDSGRTPGKDPSSRGGRNPLNPESLNPESLNPDSGILNPERTPASPPPPPAGAHEDGPGEDPPPEDDGTAATTPTPAGRIGMAMRRAGVHPSGCNPSDPTALALIERGVTVEQFEDTAREAVAKGIRNPWPWVLATLRGRISEASAIAAAPAAPPDPMAWRKTLDGVNRRAAELGLSVRTGETLPEWERRVLTAHQRAARRQEAAA